MTESFDLVIVGAGPAGMSAAVAARALGLSVLVADDQATPGGQIWRAIERRADRLHGAEDRLGLDLVRRFRGCGADYRPATEVWQIENANRVFLKSEGRLGHVKTRAVLLATGAMERPVPFPGWTLTGVATLGAAQIMLKSAAQIPDEPVWIAGNGPLALLYAVQLLDAGGKIAGFLDTTASDAPALPPLAATLKSLPDLWRGAKWMTRLRAARIPVWRGVSDLRGHDAPGTPGALAEIGFRDGGGQEHRVATRTLLVHEGVVPRWHIPSALGCALEWNDDALAFRPATDAWGASSVNGIFIAGDGAGIAGARAALVGGEIAALGVARLLDPARGTELEPRQRKLHRDRERLTALRPFLDRRYRPGSPLPDDTAVICRCENVRAGELREAARAGAIGPNQAKAYTRCGMGPCQGRQCGYAAAAIIAAETGDDHAAAGLFRVRPPYRPVTLGQLSELERES